MFRFTDDRSRVFDEFGPSAWPTSAVFHELVLPPPPMPVSTRRGTRQGAGKGRRQSATPPGDGPEHWERAVRKLLREQCPATPGVYGMIDAEGRLIYVGKSKSLCDRLQSYFVGKGLESKSRRIITYARRLVWEPTPHEFTALLRELELIRRWCPRFNVRGRPGRVRRAYLAIGGESAPRGTLVAGPSPDDRLVVGPMPRGRRAAHLVRTLNDAFQLRDCPGRRESTFSEQAELFETGREPGCLRFALGACLGPCAGACSARRYADRVRQARDFLRGADVSVLDRLERSMREAAAAAQFERAATLRDAWREMADLRDWLDRLRRVRRTYSFVYPVPRGEQGEAWCFVQRGQVVAAEEAPRNRTTARACLRRLDAVYPPRRTLSLTPVADDPDMVLLVSLWFRAQPDELERTLTPDAARQRCAAWTAKP